MTCFLIASFVLFGNGIAGDFVFDDHFVITGNPLVEEGVNPGEIFASSYHYKQPETGLYRPLTILSYSLNRSIFGSSPASFHVVNIILHALTSFFLFRLLSLLIDKKISLLAAVLFLFLPIHVEAVTSIIGRAEILSALFVLLALIKALEKKMYWSAGYFLLALLSKEIAIAFLPIWAFILFRYKNQKPLALLKQSWPYLSLLAIYFGLRYLALGSHIFSSETQFTYNPLKHLSFATSLWTALKVAFLYIVKTILPLSFSSDYSYNQIPIVNNLFSSWQAITAVVILATLVWLVWRYKSWGFAALLFLAPFFIISNFVFKTGTIMAERLMYMPSLGISLLLALVLSHALNKSQIWRKAAFGVLGLLLIFYSYQIVTRNMDWLTEESLYMSAFKAAPDSIVNRTNRAYLYMVDNDLENAKKEINTVLAIRPEHLGALHLAGRIHQLNGEIDTAYTFWSRAMEIKPNYIRAIRNVGEIDYQRGNYAKAEETLTKAVNFYPRWNEVFLLSMTRSKLKKYDEAIKVITDHFGENPENNNLKFALGFAYYKKGDMQKAKFYFDQSRNPEVSEEEFIKALQSL